MRRLFGIGVITVCLAGAALAQGTEQDAVHLEFERSPTGPDYARNYPPAYDQPGTAGIVVLCCDVNAERGLDCTSRFEAPGNVGFAQASVAVSRRFRLTQESYDRYQASERRPVRRVMVWIMSPAPQGWDEYREQVQAATANICETPAAPAS